MAQERLLRAHIMVIPPLVARMKPHPKQKRQRAMPVQPLVGEVDAGADIDTGDVRTASHRVELRRGKGKGWMAQLRS
jgi:hypothetical protein